MRRTSLSLLLGMAASMRVGLPAWVPATAAAAISEPAAKAAFASLQSVPLSLPEEIATGPVDVTFLRTSVTSSQGSPPIVLIHGFDISCTCSAIESLSV